MKAIKQYFHVVLFIMLYKVVPSLLMILFSVIIQLNAIERQQFEQHQLWTTGC